MGVDRRTLTVLAIAVLGVLALGLSAATFTPPGDSSSGDGGQTRGNSGSIVENQTQEDSSTSPSINEVRPLLVLVGALLVVASMVYMALYDRRRLVAFGVALAAILLLGLVIQGLDYQPSVSDVPDTGDPGEGGERSTQESAESSQGEGDSSSLPTLLLAGTFLVLLLVAYSVVGRTVGGEPEEESEEPEPIETTELGEIAGRAADRIERDGEQTAATDNEIYRAWEEMTSHLDIENEETTTPREFESRAVDVGMAPDDVRELRRLFESVRYGGEAATDDRERRAVTVLRRIESRYGERR